VRFLGNKRKVLPAIEALLEEEGVRGGRLLDIFTGTATVARRFREKGFTVTANDRMRQCWAHATAALVPDPDPAGTAERLRALAEAPDAVGLVSRRFAPGVTDERLFFTAENARRIDAALETLAGWRAAGTLSEAETGRLVAAVLAGADRVANISGTYGAFLKSWQPNALLRFTPALPPPVAGPAGRAVWAPAAATAALVPCDVLYLDPPYNDREYSANYHVLEALAARPFLDGPALAAFEATIYGKTGLLPYERSDFCDPRRCSTAFRDLIARSSAATVVVSYSEEGILTRDEIAAALRDGLSTLAVRHDEVSHRRFRSDKDGARRTYRVLDGRSKDEVKEWLFFARRPEAAKARRVARAGRARRIASSAVDNPAEAV